MFWTKKKAKKAKKRHLPSVDPSRRHPVKLAHDTFVLTLPEGTEVDDYSHTMCGLLLPGRDEPLLCSVSSHDLMAYGLMDMRPVEGALGQGEYFADPLPDDPADDYGPVIRVGADDGPYAECDGYLLRVQFFRDRYLRALRIAVYDPGDRDAARDLLETATFAEDTTFLDDDTVDPDSTITQIGDTFRFASPPNWTVYPLEKETEDDDDSIVCVAPDERCFAKIGVSGGAFLETDMPPEMIEQMLADHLDMIGSLIEEEANSPAIVVARTENRSLVSSRDSFRAEDGQFSRTFHLLDVSPIQVIQATVMASTAGDDPIETDWSAGIEAIEAAIRAIQIHHPRRFTVGAAD